MKIMNKTKNIILLSVSTLFLLGCFASVPKYQGDMSGVPKTLSSIDEGQVRMGLPDGWKPTKAAKYANNWAAEIQHAYKKEVPDGVASFTTLCYTMFLSKDGLADVMRSTIDTNAVKVIGPNHLDTSSMLDPEFEVYNFNTVTQGMKIPMTAMIGWKLDSRINGCKYGIYMAGPRSAKTVMLNDFLAIMGSLE